ncbi:Listeria-Bacteroides repeat domain (List_Bact_rpt) [uncultured Blautia sp.]|jgi:hypothetical protein|nr:InlB B-repeat-containing protein [uncultured Blautia sp.]SCH47800.1 Listeria-Bacteroides repeat domain (List_Bact_rpt) [uncultured Blautia sp.]
MKKTQRTGKAFRIKWLVLALAAMALILMPAASQKVSASKLVYTVKFNNNSGTSKSKTYTSLTRNVTLNTTIKLPSVPKAVGYQNLGWTTQKGSTKVVYKAGASVKVKKDMTLYAVRRKSKYYTVSFYLGNGSTNAAYKKLTKSVEEGTYYTLPSVPSRTGYVNLGWSTTKNGKSSTAKKAGTKIKIAGNIKYYAVQMQSVSVNLCKANGTVWKTVTLGKGGYLKLPSASNASGYTFMGWSKTKRSGSAAAPDYEAGELLKVSKNTSLYATVFNRSKERDITADEMARPAVGMKYSKVIFVGDSRTVGMYATLNKQIGSSSSSGVSFVASAGQGLSWFQSEGYAKLLKEVEKAEGSLPVAVVFNLGVNDMANASNYVSYMTNIASTLKSKNCKLFYMSVNPLNSTMITKAGKGSRTEAQVREFNSKIRSGLSANYKYIDTYSVLMKTGYGTNASYNGEDSVSDDGLHYTTKTFKRIYYYCVIYLNTGSIDSFYY